MPGVTWKDPGRRTTRRRVSARCGGWTCASDSLFPRAGGWTSSASSPTSSGMSWPGWPSAPSRSAAGSRSGSTTTSTPCPSRREEATHEAWTLMAALRRGDQPGPPRARCAPAWATATRPTWPRSPRRSTSSPGAASRWASAPAGTSTSGGPTATASRPPASGSAGSPRASQIFRDLWTTGIATPAGQALPGRRRDLPAARRCRARPRPARHQRHPDVDRRRRREEDPADRRASTPTTPTSTARSRGSRTRARCCAGHCADVGRDFDAIVRSANYNVVIGETEAGGAGPPGLDPRPLPQGRSVRAGRRRADGRPAQRPAGRARPSRSSRTSRRCRTRA